MTAFAGDPVHGSEQPLLPDAPVQVQQQNPDRTWTTVANGTVDADGTFAVPVALTAGRHATASSSTPGRPATRRRRRRADRGALMRRVVAARSCLAALAAAAPAAAFAPADPLAPKQWYLAGRPRVRRVGDAADDARAGEGRDRRLGHRLLAARLRGPHRRRAELRRRQPAASTPRATARSSPGIIAANLDTQGIVGIAYTAQLLIAKVVKPDGTIPLEAEAAAIRWAADQGARVINLSLGGVRDPVHPNRDTYSPLEASAVAYAYAKGALLVAAVGNGDEAFSAAVAVRELPGRAAARRRRQRADALGQRAGLLEPRRGLQRHLRSGLGHLLDVPAGDHRATADAALDQGYSDCGTDDYRNPEGTSFAAPQVVGRGRRALRRRTRR